MEGEMTTARAMLHDEEEERKQTSALESPDVIRTPVPLVARTEERLTPYSVLKERGEGNATRD